MKKVIMLFVLMFLLTGCNIMGISVVRIKTDNIDNILNVVLSKDNDLYNKTGKGYKYYKPMGVLSIDTNEFNEKLYSNGNYYYLYVDINAYYYKKEVDYVENKDLYYSRKFEFNGKDGYLQITNKDDKYFIELTITEGRFHQIKRMVKAIGGNVTYLKRISMGNLFLDENLKKGDFRPLTDDEVLGLKNLR